MVIIRRLPITLLEMLIVISIVLLGSGILAISVNKMLVDQRFRTEVEMVVDKMRLAQDLMLILGTDVHLNFKENEKGTGIEYWLEIETKLPTNIQHEVIKKKRETLKTIRGVFLADKLVTEVKEKHIDVKFLSNGAVMSKGAMRLATSDKESPPKGTLERFICLAGYPRPIVSTNSKEEADTLCSTMEEDLDERITQDTLSRIPEKLKQPDSPNAETTTEDDNELEKKDNKVKDNKNSSDKEKK